MKNRVGIIGAGPSGISAAIQLRRSEIIAILFDTKPSGSLLQNAWLVENYLGICPGLSGAKLLHKFHETLAKWKIKPVYESVKSLDYDPRSEDFIVKIDSRTYKFDYVIVASGTKPKSLDLFVNLEADIKARIFSEAFPLLKLSKKTIVIIGGGDAAFDNALNLSQHNRVLIFNRNKESNALPRLVATALKSENIEYYVNFKLCDVSLESSKQLKISFVHNKSRAYLHADYLLQAIGRLPQKDFYTERMFLSERSLITKGRLFLAGDVKNAQYRQVAIAVSDGIIASMKIFHNLNKKSNARNR